MRHVRGRWGRGAVMATQDTTRGRERGREGGMTAKGQSHIRRLRQWSHTVRLGTCRWFCGWVGEPDAGAEAADADGPVRSAGETAALVSSGAGGTAEMKSEAGSSSVFIVPVGGEKGARARRRAGDWDRKMGGRSPTEGGRKGGPQISAYSVVRSPQSAIRECRGRDGRGGRLNLAHRLKGRRAGTSHGAAGLRCDLCECDRLGKRLGRAE